MQIPYAYRTPITARFTYRDIIPLLFRDYMVSTVFANLEHRCTYS